MTQLNAIIGSCLKWWRIRYQGADEGGREDCPLCQTYEGDFFADCEGCPVYMKTGERLCGGTPCDAPSTTNMKPENASAELQFLFDLITPHHYPNVTRELAKGDYPKKFITWMERAITRASA